MLAQRTADAIQLKLDRLDEAFHQRPIDFGTCDRHAERLRQELALLRMDRHAEEPALVRAEHADRRANAETWALSRRAT